MARILIIEDNERPAGLIADGLAAQGHVCDAVHTLAAAEDGLACTAFDGIVLDLGLPDGDGVEWMLTRHGPRPPILVPTARDALEDRICGLDAGADERSGLAAAMHVREQLLAAWSKDEDLVLDLREIASGDLGLIQTIEAARVLALSEGRTLAFKQPANAAIAAVLEQSGLLWAADPADLEFWFHQGEDA